MQCRRRSGPWRSKLVRLRVLNEWHKTTRRLVHKAAARPRLASREGIAETADVVGADARPDGDNASPQTTFRDSLQRSSPRLPPRSPILRAMDSPIRSMVRSHSSKRMLLMQLALLPMSFAAKARAPPKSPSLKARSTREKAVSAPQQAPQAATARGRDVPAEIKRILAAVSAEEKLQVAANAAEEEILQAWKKLVLLLHPDKLQRLDDETRKEGADALHEVHAAKDEMRRRQQEACAQVPAQPKVGGASRCLDATPGARKYEICWTLPDVQDPSAPVEKYEVWGPRHCSELGETYDWVLLATLPPLQPQFIIVEEAPTQQDVMWAADRVLRQTLSLAVHAVNGKGSSEALGFELPWASAFPWLGGMGSLVCNQCLRLTPRGGRHGWTSCAGCGAGLGAELAIVVRCTECGGEVLWQRNALSCTCCRRTMAINAPQRRRGDARYNSRSW
ncbi:unnamed protein product [Symbiodinium natans]|uniref:J domain-containing protein n=1 Tax=Symbiodinium natans TaxID=878477 RepID=A0A812RVH0_9DINO|nr:unnamed protein product [Symbiodinium natans]